MVYSVEDRILMENLYKFKNYGAKNGLTVNAGHEIAGNDIDGPSNWA